MEIVPESDWRATSFCEEYIGNIPTKEHIPDSIFCSQTIRDEGSCCATAFSYSTKRMTAPFWRRRPPQTSTMGRLGAFGIQDFSQSPSRRSDWIGTGPPPVNNGRAPHHMIQESAHFQLVYVSIFTLLHVSATAVLTTSRPGPNASRGNPVLRHFRIFLWQPGLPFGTRYRPFANEMTIDGYASSWTLLRSRGEISANLQLLHASIKSNGTAHICTYTQYFQTEAHCLSLTC